MVSSTKAKTARLKSHICGAARLSLKEPHCNTLFGLKSEAHNILHALRSAETVGCQKLVTHDHKENAVLDFAPERLTAHILPEDAYAPALQVEGSPPTQEQCNCNGDHNHELILPCLQPLNKFPGGCAYAHRVILIPGCWMESC